MSIKVLHVLDHSLPYFSGYSFRTNAILTHQKNAGIDVWALTSPKHERATADSDVMNGVRYHRCRFRTRGRPIWFTRVSILREWSQMALMRSHIEGLIAQHQIDLVHAHSPSLNGVPALIAARRFRIPAVYEVRAFWEDAAVDHGTFAENSFQYKLSRRIESWLLRQVSAVTTLGEAMRREIIERGVPGDRVHVFPNGVDVVRFSPDRHKANTVQLPAMRGKIVYGFIGSFYRYEGLDLVVHAMRKVVQELDGAVLLLIGDGEQRSELEALVEELGLGSHVVFTGRVPHDKVPAYYSLIDILIYPRRSMRLTELVTPLKPLEAMAMGKTVLASNVGGIRELVVHGQTGFLFRAGDLADLVRQMIELGQNRAARQNATQKARAFVVKDRDWCKIVSRYLDVYKGLLPQEASHSTTRAAETPICSGS